MKSVSELTQMLTCTGTTAERQRVIAVVHGAWCWRRCNCRVKFDDGTMVVAKPILCYTTATESSRVAGSEPKDLPEILQCCLMLSQYVLRLRSPTERLGA